MADETAGSQRDHQLHRRRRSSNWLAYNPELPDASFAKIMVLTESQQTRDRLTLHLRQKIADGLAPEARLRVTQFVFGPYSHFPVALRVMGPDSDVVRRIAKQVNRSCLPIRTHAR